MRKFNVLAIKLNSVTFFCGQSVVAKTIEVTEDKYFQKTEFAATIQRIQIEEFEEFDEVQFLIKRESDGKEMVCGEKSIIPMKQVRIHAPNDYGKKPFWRELLPLVGMLKN